MKRLKRKCQHFLYFVKDTLSHVKLAWRTGNVLAALFRACHYIYIHTYIYNLSIYGSEIKMEQVV